MMDAIAVVARLLLAGVFAVSGVAKLRDRAGTEGAVRAFGFPERTAGPVATLLPLAECAVSLGLLPGSTARVASVGAIALLAAFIAGISWNLAQGRRPDCHCFGQLHSAPVGPWTLARNVVLAAAAGVVAFGAGPDAGGSVLDALRDLDGTGVVLLVVSLVTVSIALWVLARRGLISGAQTLPTAIDRPAGLPVGTRAPGFSLTGSSGATVTLDGLLAGGKAVLLAFFAPTCGPCARIAPELARWQRELTARLTVAVVSSGSPEAIRQSAERYDIGEVLVDADGSVAKSFNSGATPGALLIGADGFVRSEYAAGEALIGELLLEAFDLSEVVAAHKAEAPVEEHTHDEHEHESSEEPETREPKLDPERIDRTFVPVARADVSIAERDGEMVLIDAVTGTVHVLNPTAAIVWQCLDGSGSIAQIVADISDVFERGVDEVTDNVLEVVRRFGRQGLLEGVGVPDPEPAPAQQAT